MRVAIWTTASLEPEYEAVSKEIQVISKALNNCWIFSVSQHITFRFSWKNRILAFNPKFYVIVRIIFPMIERLFDANLVYGDVSPWIYHKALTRKPIVHTVTQTSKKPVVEFLHRCSEIVVQTAATRDQIINLGISESKVHLWYPGLDLNIYHPIKKTQSKTTRILFATAPRSKYEMHSRGCYLLIDTAKKVTDVSFRFLYRPWRSGYTSLETTKQAIVDSGVINIELSNTAVAEMNKVYCDYDYTIVPYTEEGGGKECPNSVVEGLACGVPVLISNKCPFAQFVIDNNCGLVFEPTVSGLVEAINKSKEVADELSMSARKVAIIHFNIAETVSKYKSMLAILISHNQLEG